MIALPGDEGRPLKDAHLSRRGNLRDAELVDAARSQRERASGTLPGELRAEPSLVRAAGQYSAATHLPGKPLSKRGQATGRAITDIGADPRSVEYDAGIGQGFVQKWAI